MFEDRLPWPFDAEHMWVKADMVYTMGFHRLNLPFYKSEDGKRVYVQHELSPEHLHQVRLCMLEGLGLGRLKDHL